jgi:tetraprenyl-beta-curcumene synthase
MPSWRGMPSRRPSGSSWPTRPSATTSTTSATAAHRRIGRLRALHESMPQALAPESDRTDWYRSTGAERGGYLADLVETCREALRRVPPTGRRARAAPAGGTLRRTPGPQACPPGGSAPAAPGLVRGAPERGSGPSWYEFAAATGSTLGIFCLVSSAFREGFRRRRPDRWKALSLGPGPAHPPGLPVDQEEDRQGGDLNFCTYYPGEETSWSACRGSSAVRRSGPRAPEAPFHRMIIRGSWGSTWRTARWTGRRGSGGWPGNWSDGRPAAVFFFLHCWAYRRIRER